MDKYKYKNCQANSQLSQNQLLIAKFTKMSH